MSYDRDDNMIAVHNREEARDALADLTEFERGRNCRHRYVGGDRGGCCVYCGSTIEGDEL
jgi:hypothetical protein